MNRFVRGLLSAAAFVAIAGGSALAGVEEGRAAFEAGDYATAYRELLPVAEGGDTRAQVLVGLLLKNGAGVGRDDAAAIRWFEKAAALGSGEGMAALGIAYFQGSGVQQDLAKAAEWMTRGADAGDAGARVNLGLMHLDGKGVAADPLKARRLFEQAADQDESRAQIQLGLLAAQGAAGVAKNPTEALKWFTIVARKADDDFSATAMDLGQKLIEEMTDDDIMEAQRRARDWRSARD